MKHTHPYKRTGGLTFILKLLGISIGGLGVLLILLLLLLPRPVYKSGFTTLHDLQQLAKSTQELVPMSNKNTLKPEFETYYQQFKPTFSLVMHEKLTYLATFLHLTKPPIFSAGFFKTIIETMAKEREGKGQMGGTIICKVTTTENSKFVLFGNLQGAFHSFVRDLEKLKNLSIINDQLQVTQPDTYVFFTGNVISRACYSMETMAAVVRFVQVNPDRVFYLKGNHEKDNYWQEHTLKTELQIRAAHLSQELIPLASQVNKFFDTLPEAAYLTIPGTTHEFIRISHYGRTQSDTLNENTYASFLTESSPQPISYTVLKEKKDTGTAEQPIMIKVIFRNEKKRESYQPMEGLRLLAPDIDSVAWNILSSPTSVYQRAIKFKHDAFVILEAHKNIDDWKLKLYSRDATTQTPFKITAYNMLSGIDLATKKQIERDRPKKAKKNKKDKKIKTGKKKPPRSLVPSEEEKGQPQVTIEQAKEAERSQLVPPPPPPTPTHIEDVPPPPPTPVPAEEVPPPPPTTAEGRQPYPPAPIYQTIIYPPPGAQLPPAGTVAVTPQSQAAPASGTQAPVATGTDKTQQTLEKIHNLLLHVSTTLDHMQQQRQAAAKKPSMRPKATVKKAARKKYTQKSRYTEPTANTPSAAMPVHETDEPSSMTQEAPVAMPSSMPQASMPTTTIIGITP